MGIDLKYNFSTFREKYLGNIRFWIFIFFIIRLYGITDPPLEIAHNWRQVTGDMVARNFYEVDNNILYPRLDIAGEKTGITGTEFSVLNYLMYLLSLIFGFHDWFGRLINLTVSSFGVLYFYKLLKLRFEERFSFFAAFILLTSVWFMFSRKVMPDTFSISLVIIGIYHVYRYADSMKYIRLLYYVMFVTAGVLSKIPAAYLLVVVAYIVFDKNIALSIRAWIISCSILIFIPVIWWYFYHVPFLTARFGFSHYYMGTGFAQGFHELADNLAPTFEKFYFDALKFSGFAAFVAGLILAFVKKEKKLLLVTGICTIAFLVFMLKAGRNFYHHSYYVVPFVPVMSLLAAYAVMQIRKEWMQIAFVLIITVESIANQQHDLRIKYSEKYKLSLEAIADSLCEKNTLVAVNGDENPQLMYFLHRKGWTISSEKVADNFFLKELQGKGCEFLFLDKKKSADAVFNSLSEYKVVFEDQHFIVYSLVK